MVICCFVALEACDVHEFPDTVINNFEDEDQANVVRLNLSFDTTMPLYSEVTESRVSQVYDVRYIVEAYAMKKDGTYNSSADVTTTLTKRDISSLNQSIDIRIGIGSYRIIAWAEYVYDDDEDELFFNTSTLSSVSINDKKAYSGNTDMADSFRAVAYIQVTRAGDEYDLEMKRPMAKYQIIASDVETFAQMSKKKSRAEVIDDIVQGNYSVVVTYYGFVPTKYNLVSDFTADSRLDLHYDGTISMISENEALLGFDYVFINTSGGTIELKLTVYDADGEVVTQSSVITVPLMQGELTVVRGNFLSTAASGSGGLGLNPDFDGPDFNIKV